MLFLSQISTDKETVEGCIYCRRFPFSFFCLQVQLITQSLFFSIARYLYSPCTHLHFCIPCIKQNIQEEKQYLNSFPSWDVLQTGFWAVSYGRRDDTAEILAFIFPCYTVMLLLNFFYWRLILSLTEVVKSLNTCPEVWSYIPVNNILNFCRVSCCTALCIEQSLACIFTLYENNLNLYSMSFTVRHYLISYLSIWKTFLYLLKLG